MSPSWHRPRIPSSSARPPSWYRTAGTGRRSRRWPGRDQNDTAARVVHHGAGIRLSPKASVPDIRSAVTQVLGEERYRSGARRTAHGARRTAHGARRLAEVIADDDPTTELVDELESLAKA
jgi:hypothetical protein